MNPVIHFELPYDDDARAPAQHPSVVIAVDDVDAAMKMVASAGGRVLGDGEVMDIPAVGRYVSFVDTEGNRLGLLQPLPRT